MPVLAECFECTTAEDFTGIASALRNTQTAAGNASGWPRVRMANIVHGSGADTRQLHPTGHKIMQCLLGVEIQLPADDSCSQRTCG